MNVSARLKAGHHRTSRDSVGEVAGGAADEKPERDGQDRVPGAGPGEVPDHPEDRERGQDRHDLSPGREEPEGDARVPDVVDRERPRDVDRLAELELADDQLLRELVGEDGRERHGRERDPVEGPGGERALGHGDGHPTVRSRTDAHVDQAGGRVRQARSSRRLQSMHFVA
jgi:hypothetical protein